LFSHLSFGRLCPLLNLKILVVAPLRLRFYSIVTAKSVSKYSVIPEKLIYGQALKIYYQFAQFYYKYKMIDSSSATGL
jgi:hypothetical protein